MNNARRLQPSFQSDQSSLHHHSVQFEFAEPVNDPYKSHPSSCFTDPAPSAPPGETASSEYLVFGQFLTVDREQMGPRQSVDSFYDSEEGNIEKVVVPVQHQRSPSLANALARVRETIVGVSSQFECPVCFDEMKPPLNMFQCCQGHTYKLYHYFVLHSTLIFEIMC